jgi:D-alanyl-D-alanine carboxypeptidase (penicillin-binding protein 5/6)
VTKAPTRASPVRPIHPRRPLAPVACRAVKLRLVALLAALALAAPALAANPPRVAAEAYVVQNSATEEVLAGRDARERLPIASITKLMTVLVALERSRPKDVVSVPAVATAVPGSTIHLRPGERVTVGDLIQAALIQSANDAAYALAYHAGDGSVAAFVRRMNARARSLGLTDTRFVRPDGLDASGHLSSARDATKLARIAMHHPVVRNTVRKRTATIAGGRRLTTWNDLLWSFPGLLGVKTGHTSRAGWSEVAAARGRGLTIYATLLGSPSRTQRNSDLTRLLAWGLSQYRVVPVISGERVYAQVETQYGRRPIRLVADRPLRVVVRVGRSLVERVVAPVVVELPVRKGQRLGEVRVYERGRLIGRRSLVAAAAAERPGLFGRAGWYVKETFSNMRSWLT